MHRMSGVDAQFLVADDGRQHTHVSMLTILEGTAEDGTPVTMDRIRTLVEERLPLMPLFKWRLKMVPLNLDYPVWIEDPDFDLDEHLWEMALPKPGTDRQLGDLVGSISSRPLDLQRPMWELYLIHGLEGGRLAILTKIHHSAIDGVSGVELTGTILDRTPEGRTIDPPVETAPQRAPSDVELALRGLAALPRQAYRAARVTPRTLRKLDQAPTMRNLPGGTSLSEVASRVYNLITRGEDGEILSNPAGKAPVISMGGPVSAHRGFAFISLDFNTVSSIRAKTPGTTINDVVVALCSGAMRRRLQARGDALLDPLIAGVPLHVGSGASTHGNHISMMYVQIPTNEPDPAVRLAKSHEALVAAKSMHHAVPAPVMVDASYTTPPAMLAGAARTLSVLAAAGLVRPTHNVTISNIPGPQVRLYCAGAKVIGQFPVNVMMDGMAASLTILTYNGDLNVTITTDRHNAPDFWELAQDIADELEALAVATGVAE
jgi:diacylglycerol O-acyltransferase / wax synthase